VVKPARHLSPQRNGETHARVCQPVNDVGEPCAGEPHARFDAAAGGNPGPVGRCRAVPGRLPPTLQRKGPQSGDRTSALPRTRSSVRSPGGRLPCRDVPIAGIGFRGGQLGRDTGAPAPTLHMQFLESARVSVGPAFGDR
jgi:hypothetical protein